jgi:large subunit ribosomal protein L25
MQAVKVLTIESREGSGKGAARKLRAADRIPGVLYGAGRESKPVTLDRKAFELLVKSGGHHGLLDVTLGSGQPIKALVREVQVHPVSREYVHVDLQSIKMTEKIRIAVPVVLLGKPEGVKTQGGILEHSLRSIEVECLPGDIPAQIEVDVSQLMVGNSLHVSDLKVTNVTLMAHADTAIATVTLPAAERAAEETPAAAEAAATPEGEAAKAAAPGAAPAKGAEAKPGAKAPEAKPGKGAEAKGGAKESKGKA